MSEERPPYNGEQSSEELYQIRDEASPRDYFSQIPNLVDLMELSPYSYRLYGHLRKVAGETGKCWQSTKTLADACNMSIGMVSQSKQELENVYPPLIRIESKTFDRGAYHEITITDIWTINHAFFTGAEVTVKTAKKGVFHNMNEWRSQYETLRSQYETKKNPVKEEPRTATPISSDEMPIDWKIGHGQSITEKDVRPVHQYDPKLAQDVANQIDQTCAGAGGLALAFMEARRINFPMDSKTVKAQRKAAKQMLEMHVKPQHITAAVAKLLEARMTITDLYSVNRTAVDLANPANETSGPSTPTEDGFYA